MDEHAHENRLLVLTQRGIQIIKSSSQGRAQQIPQQRLVPQCNPNSETWAVAGAPDSLSKMGSSPEQRLEPNTWFTDQCKNNLDLCFHLLKAVKEAPQRSLSKSHSLCGHTGHVLIFRNTLCCHYTRNQNNCWNNLPFKILIIAGF